MMASQGGLAFRRTYSSMFSQGNYRSKFIEPLVCPLMLQQNRGMQFQFPKKKESLFPQTPNKQSRQQDLFAKLNPPPKTYGEDDMDLKNAGFRTDSVGQILSGYIPKARKSPKDLLDIRKVGKDLFEATKATAGSLYATYKIKRNDTIPYKSKEFARFAQKKHIDLNNDLQLKSNKNVSLRLRDNATLNIIRMLKQHYDNPKAKLHWRFAKELEAPKVVNANVQALNDKDNLFAQVTVKMCYEQILAGKDRYGRIVFGSLNQSRKVIEFIVFERQIKDAYGKWRICGKINRDEQ